jgi:FAD synthetase
MTDGPDGPGAPDGAPAARTGAEPDGREGAEPTDRGDVDVDADAGRPGGSPTRAVAQGTFDILHPGHYHYLSDAAGRADELHVIVARGSNVTHKERPVLPDRQRRDMVAALDVVDEARLGHAEDIFVPIREIDPDVIVLGYDQHHDPEALRRALADRELDARVERASAREPRYEGELLSTGRIVDRVLEERGRVGGGREGEFGAGAGSGSGSGSRPGSGSDADE